jgi:phosphoserine phosphatase
LRVELRNKGVAVQKLIHTVKPTIKVAVGDSQYDISMFKVVDFAIAFNPREELQYANVIVRSEKLSAILPPIYAFLNAC